MILHALVSYYETLAARGELPQPGWAPVKVSYVLNPVSYTHLRPQRRRPH